MIVTNRKPKWFQEILTSVLVATLLGLLPARGLTAEPPAPGSAKDQPLPDVLRRQIARLQLETDLKELVQVRSNLRKTAIELEVLQAEMTQQPDTISDEAVDQAVEQHLALKENLAAVKKKQDELAQLETSITGGRESSIYKAEQARLSLLEKELAARRRKLRPVVENELKQKSLVELSTRIKSAQERITIAKELEKKLLADIRRRSGEAGAPAPVNEDRLRILEKEVANLKKALDALQKKAGKGE